MNLLFAEEIKQTEKTKSLPSDQLSFPSARAEMAAIILRARQISHCGTVGIRGQLARFLKNCYFHGRFLSPLSALPLPLHKLRKNLREEVARVPSIPSDGGALSLSPGADGKASLPRLRSCFYKEQCIWVRFSCT